MPPRAAEFAVRYSLKANLFLLLYKFYNLGILHFIQLFRGNFAVLVF